MITWGQITGFDWDAGNFRKNADKHDVSQSGAEQIFFNQPLLILADEKHGGNESRYHALGVTADGRLLYITFTLRKNGSKIRVIFARDMDFKERASYEHCQKDS